MDLVNKVIVITGASDGIGREAALRLAQEKTRLALISRSGQELQNVVVEAKKLGAMEANAYSCDVTDASQIEQTVNKIITDYSVINILLNIAGVWQKLNYIENIPPEEIDKVIDINLKGVIKMTHFVLPHLREAKEAAIINFASRSGVTAQPGQAIYCASKWGVRGFTEVLKEDLKDTHIRVAGVYPAGIATGLLEKAGDKISLAEYSDPKDIANTLTFIISQPEKIWLHDVRITY